ncbi:MAG: hypothetical protein H0U69_05000, partial [Trueperaceae bacterium]|nr:hypothetical protein [Trueperaceae bacterium]
PKVWITKRFVFKVAVHPRAIRQLAREVAHARRATSWTGYGAHVIEQRLWTPFVAVSAYREPEADPAATATAMIALVRVGLGELHRAPRTCARELLEGHRVALHIERCVPRDLYVRYRRSLDSGFFAFPVPRTPMHGDFAPQNTLLHRRRLYLLDWEYASDGGSLLYDAWFLRRSLLRSDRWHTLPEADVTRYLEDLEHALHAVSLRSDQFDAFGHAVHALVDFSRHELRGSDVQVLAHGVREIERLVEEAETGGCP